MAFALIGHAQGSPTAADAGNTTVIDALDTTGADLLVVAASILYEGGRDFTVSDNYGNTYTKLTTQFIFGNVGANIAYCAAPVVGAGHVVTLTREPITGFAPFAGATLSAWSGAYGVPFNAQSGNNAHPGTSVAPGALNPITGALVIAVWGSYNLALTPAIDSGFTLLEQLTMNFGFNNINHASYAFVSSGGAINPTVSWTGSDDATLLMASFVPVPVVPITPPVPIPPSRGIYVPTRGLGGTEGDGGAGFRYAGARIVPVPAERRTAYVTPLSRTVVVREGEGTRH